MRYVVSLDKTSKDTLWQGIFGISYNMRYFQEFWDREFSSWLYPVLLIPCGNWCKIAPTWVRQDRRWKGKPRGQYFSRVCIYQPWLWGRLSTGGTEVTYRAFTINMGNCLTSCTIWFNGMSDEWHMVVCQLKISWRPLSKPRETSRLSHLTNSCALPWIHIIAETDRGGLEVLMLSY